MGTDDDDHITFADFAFALGLITTIGDVIRESKEIPSNVLYASMRRAVPGYELAQHDAIVDFLIRHGMVTRKPYHHNVLVWIGGKPS